MISVGHNLSETMPYIGHEQIIGANGQHLSISGIGSIALACPQNSSITLSNVYFVPHLSINLIYVGQLVDCRYSVHFTSSDSAIQERQTGKVTLLNRQ